MDDIPVATIMAADELEDYLELKNPKVQRAIAKSNRDIKARRIRPASELLAELRGKSRSSKRRHMRWTPSFGQKFGSP
jgi:hypothetical protein